MNRTLWIVGLSLGAVACGGGSSSGGGTLHSALVGTYVGSETVTLSANGRTPVSERIEVTLTVRDDGSIVIGQDNQIFHTAVLKGTQFSGTTPAAVALDAPECAGDIALAGSFTDPSVIGVLSADDIRCGGQTVVVEGDLQARRIGGAAAAISRVLDNADTALRRAWRRMSANGT